MSTNNNDSNLWTYVILVAAAALASWLVALPLLSDVLSGPLSLLVVAATLLCGLRFGPIPLLLAALIYLAATEPPEMLSRRPLLSMWIAAGIGFVTICLARARSICTHHQLQVWQLKDLVARGVSLPSKQLSHTFLIIAISVGLSGSIVLFAFWLVPLSNDSLRIAGLRPTAFRAIQITFLFASAYVATRLFIVQMAFRSMRPEQARLYLGSLISGWLLPDVRGMNRKRKRKSTVKNSTPK